MTKKNKRTLASELGSVRKGKTAGTEVATEKQVAPAAPVAPPAQKQEPEAVVIRIQGAKQESKPVVQQKLVLEPIFIVEK